MYYMFSKAPVIIGKYRKVSESIGYVEGRCMGDNFTARDSKFHDDDILMTKKGINHLLINRSNLLLSRPE